VDNIIWFINKSRG